MWYNTCKKCFRSLARGAVFRGNQADDTTSGVNRWGSLSYVPEQVVQSMVQGWQRPDVFRTRVVHVPVG